MVELDLADRLQLPRRYLEHVLQALVREGILVGHRGPRGGYMLAKARQAISVYDISEAVKTVETEKPNNELPLLLGTVVLPTLAQALKRISVEDLVRCAALHILADAKPARSRELNDKLALQWAPLARKAKRLRTDL